jgi:hypothetical protein
MNEELIQRLVNQCVDMRERDGRMVKVLQSQKFAELIVRECMRMCEVTEMSFVTHDCDVEASGAITVKQFIAEHFGVDE